MAETIDKPPFLLFCEHYHITYSIYKRGEKKGQIKLPQSRHRDMTGYFAARDALRRVGYERYLDHSAYYRDNNGGTVVISSPYWLMDDVPRVSSIGFPRNRKNFSLFSDLEFRLIVNSSQKFH